MKFFKKVYNSKSYSGKNKLSQGQETLKQTNQSEKDAKSIGSFSPGESLLVAANGKIPSHLENKDETHAKIKILSQEKFLDNSPEPHVHIESKYINKVKYVDDEPEACLSISSLTALDKNDSRYAPRENTKRRITKKGSDQIQSGKEPVSNTTKAKSLIDISPIEVLSPETPYGTTLGVPILKTTQKHASMNEKPSGNDSMNARDLLSSTRAHLLPHNNGLHLTPGKGNEKFLLSHRTEEIPVEGFIPEERDPSMIGNNGSGIFDKKPHGNNLVSMSFDMSGYDNHPNKNLPDHLPEESIVEQKKTEKVSKNPKKTPKIKNAEVIDKRRSVFLIFSLYILIVYAFIPLSLLFGAFHYENDTIKATLNFGILGCIQGIVQVLLLYHLIDVPILTKITEIEGRNKGLIDASRYLVINKLNALGIVSISVGVQIAAGIIIKFNEVKVDEITILCSSLVTTAINGLLWFLLIWIKSPRTLKSEKKILDKELKEIGQIRKEFIVDLYQTRNKIEIISHNQNIIQSGAKKLNMAYLGFSSHVISNVQVDARKLLHKVYDFSSEFKRIRLKSIKAFMILMFSWAQILILVSLVKKAEETENLLLSLFYVLLIFIIGSIFGLLDLFTSPTKPVLNTMKLVSLIITAGTYRFLFVGLTDRNKMIGAVIIKVVYKTIMYCFVVLCGESIMKKIKKGRNNIAIEFYDLVQEREFERIKHPLYVFHKFTLMQEVDIFFGLMSLLLTASTRYWFMDLNMTYGLKIESFIFYLVLVILEIVANLVIGLLFVSIIKRIVKNRTKVIHIDLGKEVIENFMKKKWVVLCFKGLLLFVLLFIFHQ